MDLSQEKQKRAVAATAVSASAAAAALLVLNAWDGEAREDDAGALADASDGGGMSAARAGV